MKTVGETAAFLDKYGAFDTAVPQPWADKIRDEFGIYPPGHCVWFYPHEGPGHLMGFPVPLTLQGHIAIKLFNDVFGSAEPMTFLAWKASRARDAQLIADNTP